MAASANALDFLATRIGNMTRRQMLPLTFRKGPSRYCTEIKSGYSMGLSLKRNKIIIMSLRRACLQIRMDLYILIQVLEETPNSYIEEL